MATPHAEGASNHYRRQTANGFGSATTENVGNSAAANGNEGQDMALRAADRCVHGGKRSRGRSEGLISG